MFLGVLFHTAVAVFIVLSRVFDMGRDVYFASLPV